MDVPGTLWLAIVIPIDFAEPVPTPTSTILFHGFLFVLALVAVWLGEHLAKTSQWANDQINQFFVESNNEAGK